MYRIFLNSEKITILIVKWGIVSNFFYLVLPVWYIKSLWGIGCFDIEVLRKYLWSPKFTCTFCSDSYGTICNGDFEIPFGTIEHKVVILWGIDFNELPKVEKDHFIQNKVSLTTEYIEKVEFTDFYQWQAECVFTEPILEVSIYEKHDILNALWKERFDYQLWKNDPQNIEEILNLCVKYKKIILGSLEDFRSFIIDWNTLILEWLDIDWLKRHANILNITVQEDHWSRIILENILKWLGLPPVPSFKTLMEMRNYVGHKTNSDKERIYFNLCKKIWCEKEEYTHIYYFLVWKLLEEMNEVTGALGKYKITSQ